MSGVQRSMTSSGLLFSAQPSKSAYLSRRDHWANAAGNRNKWDHSCPPPCEYEVFCAAEDAGWRDSRPQLWGIKPRLAILGLEERCLAKFPDPPNALDPWHGYPVSAMDRRRDLVHRPEPDLVDRWVAAGVIDEWDGARIKRGKV